jgi:peptide/nickel transport system substrate-binding protein
MAPLISSRVLVDQAEAMTAVAGTDRAFWHEGIGLFPPGTPFANDAGVDPR